MGVLTDISLDIDLLVEKNLAVTVHKFGVSSDGDLKLEFQNLENFDYLSEMVNYWSVYIVQMSLNSTFTDIAGLKN